MLKHELSNNKLNNQQQIAQLINRSLKRFEVEMRIKFAFVILILSAVQIAETQIFVDETIRSIRQDYRTFRKEFFKSVDRSFFHVYNALGASLLEVVEPFTEILNSWTEMCDNERISLKLHNRTETRVTDVCSEVQILIEKIIFERDEGLMLLFPGDLTSKTIASEILEKLFFHVELQMDQIWRVYARNTSCIAPVLKSYLPKFGVLIDNICFLSNRTVSNLTAAFNGVKQVSAVTKSTIKTCIDKVINCQKEKRSQKCFEGFVSFSEKENLKVFNSILSLTLDFKLH